MNDQPHSHAKEVWSNQEGPFKDLEKLVRKYACTPYLRPIADHTRLAFADAEQFIADFYSKGQAQSAPHPVIGIDKSAVRLDKAAQSANRLIVKEQTAQDLPRNAFYVRAELIDFWRLTLDKVRAGQWIIPYHALYYPNPWPKQSEAGRRFHLHPVFPTLLQLAQKTELRTNWEVYAQEFAQAARLLLPGANITGQPFQTDEPITAFERKYNEAHQTLWRVIVSH